jgi:hypothetical protein
MSAAHNFGEISTRSVKKFCEATRKDKAYLEATVKAMRTDIAGFVKKTFTLTKDQIKNLEAKFNQPETTELFALTCIRALRMKQDISIRFIHADPAKKPNFKVSWKKCEPYPDPGQPEYADCCGVCVEWECRKAVAT